MIEENRLQWDVCQKQLDPEQCHGNDARPSGMPASRELFSFKDLSEVGVQASPLEVSKRQR
jgi:hypothetical protein